MRTSFFLTVAILTTAIVALRRLVLTYKDHIVSQFYRERVKHFKSHKNGAIVSRISVISSIVYFGNPYLFFIFIRP